MSPRTATRARRKLGRLTASEQMVVHHLAESPALSEETLVTDLEESTGVDKSSVISALRALEEAGMGRFVVGRRGFPSRFVWSEEALEDAHAQEVPSEDEPVIEPTPRDEQDDLVLHSWRLRDDFVTLRLPKDLTQNEARRMSMFIQSLVQDGVA